MMYSEVAKRYASALFAIGQEVKKTNVFLEELRSIEKAIFNDSSTQRFVNSPLLRAENKEQALKATLSKQDLSPEVLSFVLLLAKKNRLFLWPEIVTAYQAREDEVQNIIRGVVVSAAELSGQQKKDIQARIGAIAQKNAELDYEVDQKLIGGLTAQVGSLRFDDAVTSHLFKIKDDLTRRIN